MSVYDTATKLASEIRVSKEYKDFIKNMKEMKIYTKTKRNPMILPIIMEV